MLEDHHRIGIGHGGEQRGDTDEGADGAEAVPADKRLPEQREDQQQQAAGEGGGAEGVELAAVVGLALGDEPRGEQGGAQADRHVDPEDPPPAGRVGEHTAEDDAEDGGDSGERPPQAEGLVALGALGERVGQDRQRGRGDHGGAQALDGAGDDQHVAALGEA